MPECTKFIPVFHSRNKFWFYVQQRYTAKMTFLCHSWKFYMWFRPRWPASCSSRSVNISQSSENVTCLSIVGISFSIPRNECASWLVIWIIFVQRCFNFTSLSRLPVFPFLSATPGLQRFQCRNHLFQELYDAAYALWSSQNNLYHPAARLFRSNQKRLSEKLFVWYKFRYFQRSNTTLRKHIFSLVLMYGYLILMDHRRSRNVKYLYHLLHS